MITRLVDSQSKFQMLTLFSGRHIGVPRCTPTWRFHTGLCKFLQNISTNISSLGKHAGLKLGEVSPLFIFYNITISWLFPLDGFRFIFYCVTVKTIYCLPDFYTTCSNGEKLLNNVNVIVCGQVKSENSSLPVYVSKTCMLKLRNIITLTLSIRTRISTSQTKRFPLTFFHLSVWMLIVLKVWRTLLALKTFHMEEF